MPQALVVKDTKGAAGSCRGAKGGGATGSTATSVVVAVGGGFGAVAPSTSSVGSATFSADSPTESDSELVCGQVHDAADLALRLKQLMSDVLRPYLEDLFQSVPLHSSSSVWQFEFSSGIMLLRDKDAWHDPTVASWHISVWLHEEERSVSSVIFLFCLQV